MADAGAVAVRKRAQRGADLRTVLKATRQHGISVHVVAKSSSLAGTFEKSTSICRLCGSPWGSINRLGQVS
jgi:3-keto-L-gulonate-6-phosphate decarboxylase